MSDSHVLEVGNEVSARYRGAFCEATIKHVKKNVRVRVSWSKPQAVSGSATISQENIRGDIKTGKQIEAKHSDGNWYNANILKVNDASTYTVVFDDGDERTLGRNSVCIQGAKHYNEEDTLDHLPLTNPENFGTPVILDSKKQRKRRKVDTPSLSVGNVQYSGEDIGKVIFFDGRSGGGDRRKQHLVPCLISSQAACDEFIPTNPGEIIVREFKSGRFQSIPKEDMYQFDRGTEPLQSILFNAGEYTVMKPALEKALAYYDTGVLPLSWLASWDPQSEVKSENESVSDVRVRKRFNNSLQDFWVKKGCPIQRQPSIGYHDLDLYTLYTFVKEAGGPDKVTQDMKWRSICAQMKILNIPPNGSNTVKTAYYKFVAPFCPQWEGRGKRKKSTGPKTCEDEVKTSTRRSTPTPRVSTPTPRRSSLPNLAKGEDAAETESVESESSNNTTERDECMPDIHEYRVGARVKVLYGVAKMCGSYEAKIIDKNIDSRDNTPIYYIHYAGWNIRYDEWIAEESILCLVTRSTKKKGTLLEPPKDIRVIPNRKKITPKFAKSKKQRRNTSETSSTEDKNSLPSEDTSDVEAAVDETKVETMDVVEPIEIKQEVEAEVTEVKPVVTSPVKTSPLICEETMDELEDEKEETVVQEVKKAPKEEPIPIKIEAPAIKLEAPPPKVEQHLAKEEAAAILMAIPTFQIGSSTSFQQHMNSSFQQHMVSTTTAPFNPPQACILFKSPSPQYNISPPQPVSSQQFSPPQSTITAPQYTTSPRQPISSPRQQHPSPRPSSSPRHSNKAYQFANPHSSHPNASPHSSTSPHYPGVSPHSTASPHSTQLPSPLHASSSSPRGPKSPPKMVKLPVQRPSQSKTDFIISENILHSQIGAIIKLEESDSLESKKNRRKRKIQQADSTSDMGSRLQQFEFTPDPTEDSDKRSDERPKRTERDKARRGTVKNSDMGPFKLTTPTKPPELASLSDSDKRKDGRGLDRMTQQPPYWIPSSVIGSHGSHSYLRSNYPLYYGGSDLIQGGYYVPMRPPGMGPYPPGYMPRLPVPQLQLLTRGSSDSARGEEHSSTEPTKEDSKPPLPDSTVSDDKTPPHRYMDSDSSDDRTALSPLGAARVNNSMSECSDKEGTPGPKIPIFDKDFTVQSFDHLEEQDRIKAIQHAMAEMQRCYGMLKGEVATIDKKDRQKRKSKERDRKKGKQKTPKKDPERAETTSPEKS